jgi:nickel/cobalt transporter (NiCoT) family protein
MSIAAHAAAGMTDAKTEREGSTFTKFRRSLNPQDWRSLSGMLGFIILLHVVGFGILFGLVVPRHYHIGGGHPVFTVGVGVLAYTFGLRHAFDADHIAAVDNTTRKLMADNAAGGSARKPLSVGFWFSLGHSTIVFALAFLLSIGVKALAGPVENDNSTLHSVTGVIGASVSGAFLWILGILNLVVLMGIIKVFRQMRNGEFDEAALEEQLNKRGFMNRFLGGLTKSVRKPWQIYPIGVLFGLGFDTATEVGLLVLAGGAAAFNLPFYSILVLPILFAAGMCLMDTIDGVFMNAAYGWAFARPVRKVFYNITITAISVAVALVIGSIELIGVLADQAHITTGPISAIADVPLDYAGYGIVGLFFLAWLGALAVWHYGHIEEKWSADLAPTVIGD